MTVGILQLISSNGMNTIYLSGDPQITNFKSVYRRHTNFSVYDLVRYHSSLVKPGGALVFDIDTDADLLTNLVLQIDLPEQIILKQNGSHLCSVQQILSEHKIKLSHNINETKHLLNSIKNDINNLNIDIKTISKKLSHNVDYNNVIVPSINKKIDELTTDINFSKLIKLKKHTNDTKFIYSYLSKLWIDYIIKNFDILFYDFIINTVKKFYDNTVTTDIYEYITETISTDNLLVNFFTVYINILNRFDDTLDVKTYLEYKNIHKTIILHVIEILNLNDVNNLLKKIIGITNIDNIHKYINDKNIQDNDNYFLNFLITMTNDFIDKYGVEYINKHDYGISYIISKYIGCNDKFKEYINSQIVNNNDNLYFDDNNYKQFIYQIISNQTSNINLYDKNTYIDNITAIYKSKIYNRFIIFINKFISENIVEFYNNVVAKYDINYYLKSIFSVDDHIYNIMINFFDSIFSKYGNNLSDDIDVNDIVLILDLKTNFDKIKFAYYLNTFIANLLCTDFDFNIDNINEVTNTINQNYNIHSLKQFMEDLVTNEFTSLIDFYSVLNESHGYNIYITLLCNLFYYSEILENTLDLNTIIYHYPSIEKIIYELKLKSGDIKNLLFLKDCRNNLITSDIMFSQSNYFYNIIKRESKKNIFDLQKNNIPKVLSITDDIIYYFKDYINYDTNYDTFLQEDFNLSNDIEKLIYIKNKNNIINKIIFDGIVAFNNDFPDKSIREMNNFFTIFDENFTIINYLEILTTENIIDHNNLLDWIIKYNIYLPNIFNIINSYISPILNEQYTFNNIIIYLLKKFTESNNILKNIVSIYEKNDNLISINDKINKYLDENNSNDSLSKITTFNSDTINKKYFLDHSSVNKYKNYDTHNGSLLERQLRCLIESQNTFKFAWVRELGHKIIDQVKLTIGGQDYEIHDGELLSYLHQLYDPIEKKNGYDIMIGNTPEMYDYNVLQKPITSLFIPLRFFFCRCPSLSYPLIQLLYTKTTITINFSKLSKILYIEDGCVVETPMYFKCALIEKLIYLEDDERRRLSESKVDYLIERIRPCNNNFIRHIDISDQGNSIINVKLDSLNEPTKFLFWNVKFYNDDPSITPLPQDVIDWNTTGFNVRVSNNQIIQKNNPYNIKYFYLFGYRYGIILPENIYNNTETTTIYDYLNIKNIFEETTPYIFGTPREEAKDNNFYNQVSINKTYFNSLNDGQYLYSFALFPTFLQPSGHCNFAQIQDSYMQYVLSTQIVNAFNAYPYLRGEIKMWVCSMNVWRVISNMCGLAWLDTNQI